MIEMYRQARRIGAPEAAARIFEHRNIAFNPPVEALEIHLPEKRSVMLRSPKLPNETSFSKLERYFSRPRQFLDLTYQEYFETVAFFLSKEKLPKHVLKTLSEDELPPLDSGMPQKYVVKKREPCVTGLKFVSALRKEEVAIRKLLLHFPFPSFESMKIVNGKAFSTFREAAIARSLYAEGEEF